MSERMADLVRVSVAGEPLLDLGGDDMVVQWCARCGVLFAGPLTAPLGLVT